MIQEKIPVKIFADDKQASAVVARKIAQLIRDRAQVGKNAVLGLATGRTPVHVYYELIRMHREEGLDFANVITFSLDEYWPLAPDAVQSYHNWMHQKFFKSVNIHPDRIHIPASDIPENEIVSHCRSYEAAIVEAGGIDIQILGIGRSGHIGFNEPGSTRTSRTRRIILDTITRKDAASDFFGEENVPEMALTMGVGTILEARDICLMAFGEQKAAIIRQAVEGDISANVAASFLQEHPQTTVFLDEACAAALTRMAMPWLLEHCQWDDLLKRKAVIWLAQKINKPILKLTDEDYGENGLAELLRLCGGSYDLNIQIFQHLMKTITGWPGGKKESKRVLIFSPHPDDDVICMGGAMTRLVEQKHEVHVAYMVSGNLSVFDHTVARYADFVREFNSIFNLTPDQTKTIEGHIDLFLRQKKPTDVDSPEIQSIKGLIRKIEAIDAARYCGLAEDHTHFLNIPFYNTGKVQKLSVGPDDISLVEKLLEQIKPDMVFAAGDMSDPHGTHRLCLEVLLMALERCKNKLQLDPELWLYRGAWQEWEVENIDLAIPLSPAELRHKRYAVFRHESQKDRAMFPGPYDSREFWQRAEDRNQNTAAIYDQLGLPEYHALEVFIRHPLKQSEQLRRQFESPD